MLRSRRRTRTSRLRCAASSTGSGWSRARRSAGGAPVPDWVVAALPDLPAVMRASDDLAGRLERACTDVVEAAVLAHRGGEVCDAGVVDVNHAGGKVQLVDAAVLAPCAGALRLGARIRARLDGVDLDAGTVTFSAAP